MTDTHYTAAFESVRAHERAWLARRRRAAGLEDALADRDESVGLALSGGGIRSASFNTGVLQGLEERDLLPQVDYLSSVSGGGYAATCLTWARHRAPGPVRFFLKKRVAGTDASLLDWLRSHGKYLIAANGFDGWTLGTSILAASILNLIVLLPPILLLIGLGAQDIMSLSWPAWANVGFAPPVVAHDGFVLAFYAGLASLAAFVPLLALFALYAGLPSVASRRALPGLRSAMGLTLKMAVGLCTVGAVPLIVNVETALAARVRHDGMAMLSHVALAFSHAISGALFLGHSERRRKKKGAPGWAAPVGLALLIYGLLIVAYHGVVTANVLTSPSLLAAMALSVVLASVCDLNQISMHSYYRARLTEAFMPALESHRHVGLDPATARLAQIEPDQGGPLPIINTTLNVNCSEDTKRRSRGADSFALTPLYCGSTSTGYRATEKYKRGRMTLAEAMTISGAAVDPNTAATRSRTVSFVMALCNFRLGVWAPNPKFEKLRRGLPFWYVYIAREMFGLGLSESHSHVHLTDGGHFDNLGVYELLRRRCRYIVVSDAGADPDKTFSDLGLVIQRARADFNASIDLCVDAMASPDAASAPAVVGRIRYSDGQTGALLYIKPTLFRGLSADVHAYHRTHPSFPNESTANQFFDESQFDAYRELGRQTVRRLCETSGDRDISTWFDGFSVSPEQHPTSTPSPRVHMMR